MRVRWSACASLKKKIPQKYPQLCWSLLTGTKSRAYSLCRSKWLDYLPWLNRFRHVWLCMIVVWLIIDYSNWIEKLQWWVVAIKGLKGWVGNIQSAKSRDDLDQWGVFVERFRCYFVIKKCTFLCITRIGLSSR